MNEPLCPSCGEVVKVTSSARIGSEVKCHSCSTKLEVVWLDPIELDWPLDEDETDEEYATYLDDED
ncbi:MAG: hypothetical protein DWG76_03185 [Chloroflexi bacterium]|nr:hypothetical protein [Chloroflexota bacterium]